MATRARCLRLPGPAFERLGDELSPNLWAELVGYASPVMTLNVYGHVAEDSLAEAAGRLNSLATGS